MSTETVNSYSANTLVIKVSIIAALAGLLFGLDIAYVNGALDLIIRDFHLTTDAAGRVAGVLLAGAAVGALLSGWASRLLGRKKVLIIAAAIFTFVTLLGAAAQTFNQFLVARFVVGLAVGIASFVAPLYLSEIAPPKNRGALIAMFQFMVTAGIFLMFLSNAALVHTGSWRIMLLVLAVPSSIMLIGTFSLPQSPRWHVLVGNTVAARNVLLKIRSSEQEADIELEEIKKAASNNASGFSLLNKGFFIRVLILGIFLQMLQQFCGMNAFMYYSGKIFASAGFSDPRVATIIVGLVNMITTLLAIKYVDKIGRKPILYFGLVLLVIACSVVGYLFNLESEGIALNQMQQYELLASCLVFIFGFAVSLGPIIWILCPEIFPLDGRDLGLTVTTMTNWICNTVIGLYTLKWFEDFGIAHTFWGFALVSLAGIFLVKFFTPETKDIPLEEVEFNLESGLPLRKIGQRRR